MSKYRSKMEDAIFGTKLDISCTFEQIIREWNDEDISDTKFRKYCLEDSDILIKDANDLKESARKRD